MTVIISGNTSTAVTSFASIASVASAASASFAIAASFGSGTSWVKPSSLAAAHTSRERTWQAS